MGSFRPAARAIVSEVIDGEAIVIDMRSGTYFSTDGIGASLWAAAAAGHSRETILRTLKTAHPESAEAVEEGGDFLDELVANDLLAEDGPSAAELAMPVWPAAAYARPTLHQHSDMEDLIMLDPIHDVDTMGWPTRREDTTPLPVA